jgi:MFS family permease
VTGTPSADRDDPATFRLVARRLLPLLFGCYIAAYLDRVNVGFAKLQMAADLGYSDAVYGFGAGIFFIGYFLFEVPSNLILERVGARRWIARIMVSWGTVSGAFAVVERIPWGPLPALVGLAPEVFSFYALRLLLGIAEAGFFPGIILYLTYWFPRRRLGATVAWFMTAIAVANVVGAPLSGALMEGFDGTGGWAGWRWLFLLEALPAVLMGLVVLWWLPDGPRSAQWLTSEQRAHVAARVGEQATPAPSDVTTKAATTRAAFADGRVWALCVSYLSAALALYGVNFWMPTIIQELGVRRDAYLTVGLVTTIPWGLGGVAMVVTGRHSDLTGERRWHVAGSLLVCAAGLALLSVVGHAPVPSMLALSIITCGVLSAIATFWSVPASFLQASAAAAGIAWINSVGNLGGHFGPDLIGRIRTASGSSSAAFLALAGMTVLGAVMVLVASRSPSGPATSTG